jgi:hypothetical protein
MTYQEIAIKALEFAQNHMLKSNCNFSKEEIIDIAIDYFNFISGDTSKQNKESNK